MDYEDFEGIIPEGEYGAGRVIVWDRGTYTNEGDDDMADALERGHLSFRLNGEKLHGGFALTRFRTGKDEAWLLVKKSDDDADRRRKPVRSQPESVVSGRTLDELS
jgi:DNA ligase D-like protein (predicted 3'-phosphoesterase)